ncbi:MAG TPA: hypothetical protein VFQ53_17435 [Kofleriaceae bacterium]|nr:hypothetical protein [Kofleriaceae bacterium]
MAKQGDDIELMQHADGELDERASAQMRAQIERDPDARTKIESLGQMGELVRSHLELATDAVPDSRFAAMWREVEKSVDNAIEHDQRARASSVMHAQRAGVWGKLTGWFERHRGHVFTGVVSAGAVAALALVLRSDPNEVVKTVQPSVDVQPAALRAAPVIEQLETPGSEATVLNLEDEDGHTTVILVTPADTVEGI